MSPLKPDDETAKDSIRPDFLHDSEDTDPEEQKEAQSGISGGAAKDGLTSKELSAAEESAETPSTPELSEKESAITDATSSEGGLFKEDKDKPKGWRARITKKQAGIGIATLAVGGGSLGILSLVSGPLKFIHAAQLFDGFHNSRQEDHGDDRSSKFMIYMLSGRAAKGRLGIFANNRADKWETRLNEKSGLKSVYDDSRFQRLIGYEIIDENKARSFLDDMERDGINTNESSLRGRDIDGNIRNEPGRFVNFRDGNFSLRRSITRSATRSVGLNKISSKLGYRLLRDRAGVNMHPLNRARKKIDDISRHKREARRARDKQLETGDLDSPKPGSPEAHADLDPSDPNYDPDLDPNVNPDLVDLDTPSGRLFSRLQSIARTGATPLAVAGAVCALQEFSNGIDAQIFENQQQLIRMGASVLTVGSQVMSNRDIDMATLGAFSQDFYDEEKKTSYLSDPGVQDERGQEPTGKDYNEDSNFGSAEKPRIFQLVDSIPTSIELDFPPVNIGICSIFSAVDGAVSSIPGADAAANYVAGLVTTGFGAVGFDSPQEYIDRAKEYFAGGVVNMAAQGSERGGLWNVGLRLASNDQFIANGGRELTEPEAAESKNAATIERRAQTANASTYDKYFNLYESESLASKALFEELPTTKNEVSSNIARLPSMFASISSNLFGRKVAAQEATYDYGFPLYGFSENEQEDERYQDPYANEDALLSEESGAEGLLKATADREAQCRLGNPNSPAYPTCELGYSDLAELNTGDSSYTSDDGDGDNEVGSDTKGLLPAGNGTECFGMTLGASTTTLRELNYGESPDQTKIPEECKTTDSEEYNRYRFYVSDTISAHSLNCYEGDDTSCEQLGFGGKTSTGSGPVADPGQDTSALTCPTDPDITDGGIAEKYGPGKVLQYRVRLCILFDHASMDVNVSIAQTTANMISAADAEGVRLRGGGYRTYDEQVGLRRSHGCASDSLLSSACSPPTARPGTSNHESGEAIDFENCSSRSSACHQWLADNAATYGLINLPSEPWHWSRNGN